MICQYMKACRLWFTAKKDGGFQRGISGKRRTYIRIYIHSYMKTYACLQIADSSARKGAGLSLRQVIQLAVHTFARLGQKGVSEQLAGADVDDQSEEMMGFQVMRVCMYVCVCGWVCV